MFNMKRKHLAGFEEMSDERIFPSIPNEEKHKFAALCDTCI